MIAPADPLKQFRDGLTATGVPLPPGGQYLLGTDHLGRDMLSRMLYGARISLSISFVANIDGGASGDDGRAAGGLLRRHHRYRS